MSADDEQAECLVEDYFLAILDELNHDVWTVLHKKIEADSELDEGKLGPETKEILGCI